MCDDNHSSEHSDEDDWEAWEIATLALLPSMPQEIQHRVFEFCDLPSLAVLCRLDKDWNKQATPLLWRDLDFVQTFDDGVFGQCDEAIRKFFVICDGMIEEEPERFRVLASSVRSLNVGRLHGINIVSDESADDMYAYFDDGQTGNRNFFDVIALFPNLHTLAVCVKNWWGYSNLRSSRNALARGLANLQRVKVGGQMPTDILLGLLHKPETIQHLSLIDLIQSPGQDNGPNGVCFLSGMCHRFTSLKTLHLCKLADLDGWLPNDEEDSDNDESGSEKEYASGMWWEFPRGAEVSVLEEWADLLRRTSSTLEELTLENRYLCSSDFGDKISVKIVPTNTHPADFGAWSIRESQRVLFPVLSGEYLRLKRLILIGMGAVEDVTQAVCHLEPRVHVEQHLAGIEHMGGDVTPMEIATPVEFAS
jgi:hypothetical protein